MVLDDRLRTVVGAMLDLDPAAINDDTSTDNVRHWDSVHHMNLVIAIEDEFGITIPDEDVADMTSFAIIRAVVAEQLAVA